MTILGSGGYPHFISFPLTGSVAILAIALCLVAGCRGTLNTGDIAAPQGGETNDQPVVTAVIPTAAKAGAEVILFGHGFGTEVDAVDVWFGDVPGKVETVSDTELTVQVPLDAGDGLAVNIDGESVEVLAQFQYIVEKLTAEGLAPAEGPEGTEVVITGAGFGTRTEWVSVSFNGTTAEIISLAPEELRTAVPAGAVSGPVTVARGVQSVDLPGTFTVTVPQPPADPPRVDSFAPAEVYPMDEVRIAGADFGTDLANTRVYVGTVEARVVALADAEIVIRPVPGTVDAAVRVENSAGEDTSTDELMITPYPDYCASISDVQMTRLGPGGITTLRQTVPPNSAGLGYMVIGDEILTSLTLVDTGNGTDWIYQLPLDIEEGLYYLGFQNRLKDEDKPEGMENEDAWVTCYYEQPVEVTTEGMQPPVTTGLAPDVIYGSYILADDVITALESVDYNSPLAILADNECIKYYEPGGYTSEYLSQLGGIPVMFNNPPELFELGDHSLMVASSEGYSIADPGYQVASLDDVEIRVDSVSPEVARPGDLVKLSGENLYWRGAGSYDLGILQIRVGGTPVLPAPIAGETGTLDEACFVVLNDCQGGQIEVDIQEMDGLNKGQVERTLAPGLSLTVDLDDLTGITREPVLLTGLDPIVQAEFSFTDQYGLADSGELFFAHDEMDGGTWNKYLWSYCAGGFSDLGLVDQGPDVLAGYTGGYGGALSLVRSFPRPNGELALLYRGEEIHTSPEPAYYQDQRLAFWDGNSWTIHTHTFCNTVTGEGSTEAYYGSGAHAFDADGGFWMLCKGGLLHCTNGGWEKVDDMPQLIHSAADRDDQSINTTAPFIASPDGAIKVFGTVSYEPETPEEVFHATDLEATYFITRSPEGDWDQQQILGRLEFFLDLDFTSYGQARMFTADNECIYIHREENGFIAEEWLDIPFPPGMEKPLNLDYWGNYTSGLKLSIEYDPNNQIIGTLSTRFAPIWEPVNGVCDSGLIYMQFLLTGDEDGEFETRRVAVSPCELSSLNNYNLDGMTAEMGIGGNLVISPSGNKIVLSGDSQSYSWDGYENTTTSAGWTLFWLDL